MNRQRSYSRSWPALLATANADRASRIAHAHLITDELAAAAARFGIVAGPIPLNAGDDASYPQRARKGADVWNVIARHYRHRDTYGAAFADYATDDADRFHAVDVLAGHQLAQPEYLDRLASEPTR